jgi:hypothetical protein
MTGVGSREHAAGPSDPGAVVLELGPGAGALVLHVPPELNGTEIDIGPAGGHGRRTHALVRPRHIAGGTRYAAVYQDLPPGEYTIWHGDGTPAVTVTVAGAVVTTTAWPGG